jgi:hypothetical protein
VIRKKDAFRFSFIKDLKNNIMTDTDQGNLSTDESITSGDHQPETLRAEGLISERASNTPNQTRLHGGEIQTQGKPKGVYKVLAQG